MKKIFFLILAAIIVAGAGGCVLQNKNTSKSLTPDEAKAKAAAFINSNLMSPGTTATINEIVEEGGMYKMVIGVGNNQTITSYLSKDGTKFFPQVMDIAVVEQQNQAKQTTQPAAAAKSDKPVVELFVMSHCPYGTQIEKGILPAVESLGAAIDFQLKFCDYAMHGKQELDEELKQYCIQKNFSDKFIPYLKCFLEKGESAPCVQTAGLNSAQLNQCVASADSEFKVTEKYNDKTTWSGGQFPLFDIFKADNVKYGVQGSPTLVINGAQAETNRDPASLLKTICSAFNIEPEACKTQLSATTPSAGFGIGEGTDSSGSCN